jgi:excisionase family DNA binding protein
MGKVAYTIKEAAIVASVEKATVVRAIQAGELRARRVEDNALVVLRADIRKWLERQPDYLLIG